MGRVAQSVEGIAWLVSDQFRIFHHRDAEFAEIFHFDGAQRLNALNVLNDLNVNLLAVISEQ
jgi:hypothetical protein